MTFMYRLILYRLHSPKQHEITPIDSGSWNDSFQAILENSTFKMKTFPFLSRWECCPNFSVLGRTGQDKENRRRRRAASTPPMHLMISPPPPGVGDGKFSGEQRTGTTTTSPQTVVPPTLKTHIDQCLDDADRRRIGTTQRLPPGYGDVASWFPKAAPKLGRTASEIFRLFRSDQYFSTHEKVCVVHTKYKLC